MRKLTYLMVFALMVLPNGLVTRASAPSTPQPADLLRILPDGNGVVLLDLQKITGSALWSTVSAQQKLKGVIDKAQSDIADLGFKLNDVRAIALVFPSTNFNNPVAAIDGVFDQKDLLDRLRASSKIKLTSEKYKNFDVYNVKPLPPSDSKSSPGSTNGKAATVKSGTSFVFRDTSTIVVGETDVVRASIDVISGARPSMSQNAQLTDGLAQNAPAAVKFAIAVTPAMTNSLHSGDLPIDFATLKLVFGSIDVSSGIELNATLRSDSAEHAKSLADRLNGLLDMARGFLGASGSAKSASIVDALKAVSITSSNIDVKIIGSFPADLLSSLFNPSERKSQ